MQSQVDDVKGVMTQNIDKILQRGDRLEDLVDKTNDLETSVNTLITTTTKKMIFDEIITIIIDLILGYPI